MAKTPEVPHEPLCHPTLPFNGRAYVLHLQGTGAELINQKLCKGLPWLVQGPQATRHSLTTVCSMIIRLGLLW